MPSQSNGQLQQEFIIQRIYTKDLSFEAPNTPGIFRDEWKPQIELELNNHAQSVEADLFEVVLKLRVTAKQNDKVVFLVEVAEAGLFTLKNFEEAEQKSVLGSFCPSILYPYARELVANVVNRGSFPQLNLAPVNFEALYEQYEHQQAANAQQAVVE